MYRKFQTDNVGLENQRPDKGLYFALAKEYAGVVSDLGRK